RLRRRRVARRRRATPDRARARERQRQPARRRGQARDRAPHPLRKAETLRFTLMRSSRAESALGAESAPNPHLEDAPRVSCRGDAGGTEVEEGPCVRAAWLLAPLLFAASPACRDARGAASSSSTIAFAPTWNGARLVDGRPTSGADVRVLDARLFVHDVRLV